MTSVCVASRTSGAVPVSLGSILPIAHAAAHYGLGLSQFFTGGDDGHGKNLDAAEMTMRLSPNDPMMWPFLNLKGMILFENGDYQAALEVFRRAGEYPNAMFWIPLGLAANSWELGDKQGARDHKHARLEFFF